MNKLWVGPIYYFLNVILYMGAFGILFFVSVPEHLTTLEYIAEFWFSPEGKEVIILNTSLLIANLVFALSIILVASRSSIVLIIMTILAWAGLLLVYHHTGTTGLVAYAAGAIHLSYFSFNKFRAKNDTADTKR